MGFHRAKRGRGVLFEFTYEMLDVFYVSLVSFSSDVHIADHSNLIFETGHPEDDRSVCIASLLCS
jgi:hypothetical protein